MTEHNLPSNQQSEHARVRRAVLQVIFLVAVAFIVLWLIYALRSVILLLAITILFCYLIAPLVDFVERPFRFSRGEIRLPHSLAILLVYLILFGGIAFTAERILPRLSDQFSALLENLPSYSRQFDQQIKWLASLPSRYRLPAGLRQPLDNTINTLLPAIFSWVETIVLKAMQLTLYLPWLVLIPIIGFFLLKDAKSISNKLLTSFPEADKRYRVAMFLKDVSATLAAYIRTQIFACLLVGIIEGTGLWLLGMPYPLVFAVTATLFEIIPIIGPFTLIVIATLVASIYSWQYALLIAGFLLLYRTIHDYVVYPRLLSQGMEIHPLVVILAVLCGAELGGVTGVFLSVPAVALLTVCWRHWRSMIQDRSSILVNTDETPLIESVKIQD
jgi:predicted PurR-regulated permease PerM